MKSESSARFALRTATAQDHERVDAAFSRFVLEDGDGYRAFLKAQAAAFLPVERALERIDLSQLLPDWERRRRSAALIADLNELGEAIPPVGELPIYDSVEAALGAVYVLEGSRLGGRLLARRVPRHLPRRFLNAGDSAMWRTLTDVLDKYLTTMEQKEAAIVAARAVFARFGASVSGHLKDV